VGVAELHISLPAYQAPLLLCVPRDGPVRPRAPAHDPAAMDPARAGRVSPP
jgi:hypothetical protein